MNKIKVMHVITDTNFGGAGKYLYQIYKSTNFYIKQKRLTNFIKDYIDIDECFLDEYGLNIVEARESFQDFIGDIKCDDLTYERIKRVVD